MLGSDPCESGTESTDVLKVPASSILTSRLTRRRLLALGGAAVAANILAACMGDDDDDANETSNDRDGTPTLVGAEDTPESAIETPQAGASPTGSPAASPAGSPAGSPSADEDLNRFMALSRALTGFDDLNDTQLGQVYLDSIASDDNLGGQLDDLYDKAGLSDGATSVTLDQLESAGAFDDDTREVADAITTCWYTGRYSAGDDNPVVATYINALVWPATGYRMTGPSSCSGATGNWTAPIAT